MFKKTLGFFIIGVLFLQAVPAQAYWGRGWRHDYYGHRFGPGYLALTVAGLDYLYYQGLFYRYTPGGYIIVEPPVGAVVPALPVGYAPVAGTSYYYYNGIYYAAGPGGYTVAQPPASAPAPMPSIPMEPAAPAAAAAPSAVVSAAAPALSDASDDFEIYVPNQDGTYTLVTLKKTDKGFVGPQGEFYPEHPTVEKLKVLYGKSSAKA